MSVDKEELVKFWKSSPLDPDTGIFFEGFFNIAR